MKPGTFAWGTKKLLFDTVRMIGKAFRDPADVCNYAIYRIKQAALWEHCYAALREPKVRGAVRVDPDLLDKIIRQLKINNFILTDFKIDIADYKRYMNNAEYHEFPSYFGGGRYRGFAEKSLQHYLAAKLLDLCKDDIYVDIASLHSPTPTIYHRLYGCKVYRQDLIYPEGIHGNVIGGDACNMPLENGSITKMGLHCSFEHFRNDADIRFLGEASRVLRKGGKLCILPLYLFDKYAIQTDPAALPKGGMPFEKDAVLYCMKGWRNEYSRFYDVPSFVSRIRNNLHDLKLTIFVVQNEKEVDTSCYTKFVALFRKV